MDNNFFTIYSPYESRNIPGITLMESYYEDGIGTRKILFPIHGTNGILTYTFTVKNQPFM